MIISNYGLSKISFTAICINLNFLKKIDGKKQKKKQTYSSTLIDNLSKSCSINKLLSLFRFT